MSYAPFLADAIKQKSAVVSGQQLTHLNPVRHQQHRLAAQMVADAVVEDVLSDLSVNSAERVVQQVNVGGSVHCAGQVNALLLPATGGAQRQEFKPQAA